MRVLGLALIPIRISYPIGGIAAEGGNKVSFGHVHDFGDQSVFARGEIRSQVLSFIKGSVSRALARSFANEVAVEVQRIARISTD